MIRIITDSTSDISIEMAKEMKIDVVPLKVIMNGKEYKDRIDLLPEDFYTMLPKCDPIPTTSQPSPLDFYECYKKAKENKEEILVITLSSVLSGTYQSAILASQLEEFENIKIIDSYNATQGLLILVKKAVQLRDQGKSLNEIYEYLETYKKRIHIFAYVDTLEYFYKGGRLSKSSAALGSLLKFKPIVGLKDGGLGVFGKERGMKKSVASMIELIKKSGEIDLNEPVCIGYTGNDDGLDKFEDLLKEHFNFDHPLHGIVGPVIGTHAGGGARLMAYVVKEKN